MTEFQGYSLTVVHIFIDQMNENISFLYIVYQATIFFASLLGPGTIFLMIVGALVVALNYQIGMWTSFFSNLVPVLGFTIMCYVCKPDVQVCAITSVSLGIY